MSESVCQLAGDASLVAQGAAVKSTGSGRFEGFAVAFTGTKDRADATDCIGDYFWRDGDETTELEIEGRKTIPLMWSHGTDPNVGAEILGRCKFELRQEGLWAFGRLSGKGEWLEDAIRLLEANELSFSSSATGHMVKRTPIGREVNRIDYWPIGEISFTLTPCSIDKTPVSSVKAIGDLMLFSLEEAAHLSPAALRMLRLRHESEAICARTMAALNEKCECEPETARARFNPTRYVRMELSEYEKMKRESREIALLTDEVLRMVEGQSDRRNSWASKFARVKHGHIYAHQPPAVPNRWGRF